MNLVFTLPICPVSTQFGKRVQVRRKWRPGMKGGPVHFFDDEQKSRYQQAVALLSKTYLPKEPFRGPLMVNFTFYLPRPKYLMRKKDPEGPVACAVRPDLDNLEKGTKDALTRAGFWLDDGQICGNVSFKFFCEKSRDYRGPERPVLGSSGWGEPRISVCINEFVQENARPTVPSAQSS